jgi:two-component system sensor histidine kinase PilS (NtrC family)
MIQAKPAFDDTKATFWRTLQTFAFTRTVIVAFLLAYFGLTAAKLLPHKQQFWEVCIAYLIAAFIFVMLSLYWRRRFTMQLVIQISVDISAISFLYLSAGGIKSGLAILYLFPLAGGAILASLILSLFFVSIVTLILLADSGYQLLNENSDVSSSQVGLYGAAFFIIIFAINRLAARLIKQESLALGRGKALHVQQAINRLIIADVEDGILVVDRQGRVFISNPAAARMLGLTFPYEKAYGRLSDMAWLRPIADAYRAWSNHDDLRSPTQANTPTFVLIKQGEDLTLQGGTTVFGGHRELITHLKLRFAKVDTQGMQEGRVVIFLQDVTEIENRAQQLKLASMGRLTASIAHEVRNPLSAIGHAASLLSEEAHEVSQQRLLTIISDNVARLNRMIEDILKLSRKAHQHHEPLCLRMLLDEVLSELHEMHAVQQGLIEISDMTSYTVRFDPLHLREIVLNLLTNALRYASGMPGSIRVYMMSGIGHRLELHVQDDGPQITSTVRAHLFEPFYTTSNKGTGLGLYLARELCLNNGALLNYEYRSDDEQGAPTGRFVITFANNENI